MKAVSSKLNYLNDRLQDFHYYYDSFYHKKWSGKLSLEIGPMVTYAVLSIDALGCIVLQFPATVCLDIARQKSRERNGKEWKKVKILLKSRIG